MKRVSKSLNKIDQKGETMSIKKKTVRINMYHNIISN